MTREVLELEPVVALRFTDGATGLRVRDALRVDATLGSRVRALSHADGGGGWSLHPEGGNLPASLRLRANDPLGRYLPVRGKVDTTGALPVTRSIELAAAPGRSLPSGHAEVRATVLDRATRAPLPGLRLDLTCNARTSTGRADARGDVLVSFPWPAPPQGLDAAGPPAKQTWTVNVRASAPDPPASADPREFVLDADATFTAKRVCAAADGDAALADQTLRYGVPLILTTQGEKALLIA